MDDGVVGGIWTGINVHNSYGQADYWWLRSPDLYNGDDHACFVSSDGDDDNFNVLWDSCGRRPTLISIRCSSDSCNFMYQYVFFSFNNSPGNGDMYSFNIFTDGDILSGGYKANIFDSYGNNYFSIIDMTPT